MVLLTSRQPTTGVRLWGAASALREARGTPPPPVDRQGHRRALAAARLEVGAKGFDAAWAMGITITPEQPTLEALASHGDDLSQLVPLSRSRVEHPTSDC
jgi:hypothetical protein